MDVHLRRRSDGARELRVNGVFVMDDVETTSERMLAEGVSGDVLVGGLGLGYTVRELLASEEVRSVTVAELHAEVIDAVELPADPRLSVEVGDVRDLVERQPSGSLDAILLDVDNGPGFLVHEQNAALYEDAFVGRCAEALRSDGRLVIWSMADSPNVRGVLAAHFHEITVTEVPVRLQDRRESYWLLAGRGPGPQNSSDQSISGI